MILVQRLPARPRLGTALNAAIAPPPVDCPARRLLVAMLTAAVLDLEKDRPPRSATHRSDRETAIAWIAGAPAVLPFHLVCRLLDLDPDRCRQKLLDRIADPPENAMLDRTGATGATQIDAPNGNGSPPPPTPRTLVRCERCGFRAEHAGPMTAADLDQPCGICGGPLAAVTLYES